VIKMTSYAPLFVNANDRKWNPDAIVFDSAHSYGTPSYYVQKLYSLNRPDTAFHVDVPNVTTPTVGKGGIGLDTWLTQAEFKDIEVVQNGTTVYSSNFAQGAADWKPVRGDWNVVDGAYRQSGEGTDRRSVLVAPQLKDLQDYTLRLKARKLGGAEGFIVMFRAADDKNYYWWNIGGWQNHEHGIEKNVNGAHIDMGNHVPGHIDTGKWYDIRVEAEGSHVRCYLDDKLIYDFQDKGLPTLAATAGRVDKTGDVIVKIVNNADTARSLQINLDGIANVQPTGQATVMMGDSLEAENSLAQPTRIVPVTTTLTGIAPHFAYSAPPRSVSILKLKTR
jgi:alpha-L-arabinofuranosidase